MRSVTRLMWIAVAVCGIRGYTSQAQFTAGEVFPAAISTPDSYAGARTGSLTLAWEYALSHPGATYLALHFVDFELGPGDFLLITDGKGGQAYTLTGRGKLNAGTFWARHVKGDTIVLQLYACGNAGGRGFEVDEYAAGRVDLAAGPREICSADDKLNAVCFTQSHPTMYDRGRAVCRLLSNGTAFCTGWLVSPDNHVITNEHCISTPEDALNTDFDFMAEAPNCGDENCADCYPGTVFSGALLIQDSTELDYALLQIASGAPAAQFGYLALETRNPRLGEPIALIGHPAGWAKQFSLYSTAPQDPDGVAHVQSLTRPPCTGTSHLEAGYYADSVPGSSGSPVLSPINHRVVALHHCGVCPNRGIPIQLIYPEIVTHLHAGAAGAVHLDWDTYNCAAQVNIDLRDGQLSGSGTQTVTLSSTGGDSEAVSLLESTSEAGLFTGAVATQPGAASVGDGLLQVAHGQTVMVTYLDADDGDGGTNVAVTDSAVMDCQLPVISAVEATTVGALSATITVTTDEPVEVTIEYGLACGALGYSQSSAVPTTPAHVDLTNLADGQTYYYRVQATDRAGNTVVNDNGGACYMFTTLATRNSFTELFADGDNDLDYRTLQFTPNGSPSFYSACIAPIMALPSSPSGGITLSLTNDDCKTAYLFGTDRVWLYGHSYDTMYVGSNGYITFTTCDTDPTETLTDHFDTLRVSGLFENLDPSAGGRVAWNQLGDRVVVTYQNVPEYYGGGSNTFQIELFFDGRITLSYLNLTATHGLVGLSEGLGLNADFVESNLSRSPSCTPGDLDGDHDVDKTDFNLWATCLAGPGVTTPPAGVNVALFDLADLERDGDVDLTDCAGFQRLFTGP